MDFYKFFSGFFGEHRHRPNRFDDPFFQEPFNSSFNDEKQDASENSHDPFFDSTPVTIFRHIEDMFDSMFSISNGQFEFPDFDNQLNERSPRDAMLKESESDCKQYPFCQRPFKEEIGENFIDSDLDDKNPTLGITVPQVPKTGNRVSVQNFSFSKSVSSRRVLLPNGTVEEHRTTTDSEGNKVTTVRRSVGDQSYEVKTHISRDGLQEKHEHFVNMDENDMVEFEKRWKNQKDYDLSPSYPFTSEQPFQSHSPTLSAPAGDPAYMSLFKRFFGLEPK